MSTEETFAVYCAGEQIDGMDGISYIYVTTPLGKVRMTEEEAEELGKKLLRAAIYNRSLELDDETAAGMGSQPEPLVARWDRTVIHPASPGDEETIVCCLTDDGQPIALILDDEYREALGLQLVDPDGDGEAVIPPHAAVEVPAEACRVHGFQASVVPDTCTCSHPNDADCHPGGAGFRR